MKESLLLAYSIIFHPNLTQKTHQIHQPGYERCCVLPRGTTPILLFQSLHNTLLLVYQILPSYLKTQILHWTGGSSKLCQFRYLLTGVLCRIPRSLHTLWSIVHVQSLQWRCFKIKFDCHPFVDISTQLVLLDVQMFVGKW